MVGFCGGQTGDAGDLSGFGCGMLLNRRVESKKAESKMMVKLYGRQNSKRKSVFLMVFEFLRRWRLRWMMMIHTSDAMRFIYSFLLMVKLPMDHAKDPPSHRIRANPLTVRSISVHDDEMSVFISPRGKRKGIWQRACLPEEGMS